MGSRSCVDIFKKRKISCLCWELNSGSSSMYLRHYADYANSTFDDVNIKLSIFYQFFGTVKCTVLGKFQK